MDVGNHTPIIRAIAHRNQLAIPAINTAVNATQVVGSALPSQSPWANAR